MGQSFVLSNDAKAPFPDGDDVVPDVVMLFKVARRASSRNTSEVPRSLAPVPLLDPRTAVKTRDLVLTELDSAEPFENPIIARFDLPSGTQVRRGDKFRYVFHCHILEHEDNDMMRPYDVVG